MEIYTKNVTFWIWLDNFLFENFEDWEKKACFFYKFISILANETKSHNHVTKKNTFLWFLVFMCEKLILDYIINTKMSNFACKIFFVKFII